MWPFNRSAYIRSQPVSSARRDGRVILELKFAPRHAELAADAVTNSLPFRLAKCSKYVLGIERLTRGAFA